MISYQTEGVKMPDIKKKKTTGWIKEVAACYGKRVAIFVMIDLGFRFLENSIT